MNSSVVVRFFFVKLNFFLRTMCGVYGLPYQEIGQSTDGIVAKSVHSPAAADIKEECFPRFANCNMINLIWRGYVR